MIARSDAARTSRASAPIATPSAPNAAAAAASARIQSGSRLHGRVTNSDSPASSTSATSPEQMPASPIFSTSRPVWDTIPRTIRRNAFSSRSSASAPAASSRVMNMSVTVTAIAAANAPSGVFPPFTTVESTWIGVPTALSTPVASPRFWRASTAKSTTCFSPRSSADPLGRCEAVALSTDSVRRRPRTSNELPAKLKLPPVDSSRM